MEEKGLTKKLGDLPSNTIGEQLRCIGGARESYLNAMINDGWTGFSCSLEDPSSKSKILECLNKSAEDSQDFLRETHPFYLRQ